MDILDQDRVTAETVLDIYRTIGYTAMAVGQHDLSGGLNLLLESVAAGSPWISANIVNHQEKLLFPPWIIQKTDMGNVGFIGLTSPGETGEGYAFADWQQVLPYYIEELLLECDFIVLLSNLEQAENEVIAKRFPQIHLIISADQKKGNQPPQIVHNTLITQTHTRGKYLGVIKIHWSELKIWQLATDKPEIIAEKLKSLHDKSIKLNTSGVPDEIEQQNMLNQEKSTLKSYRQDNHSVSEGIYSFRFIALSQQVSEADEVQAKVVAAKRAISTLNKQSRRDDSSRTDAKIAVDHLAEKGFAGPDSCVPCHSEEVTRWQQTAHAAAITSLEREMQHYNLRCLTCHVTHDMTQDSSQDQSAYLLSLADDFRAVGCESCHGPALIHIRNHEASTPMPMVSEATCRICHTAEMDPAFNFIEKMKLIQCVGKRE
jgi:hypothetical protein